MIGAYRQANRVYVWLISVWLISVSVSAAQTGTQVSLGRPQRLKSPSLGLTPTSESSQEAAHAVEEPLPAPAGKVSGTNDAASPEASPRAIIVAQTRADSRSLDPQQVVPGFDSRRAKNPQTPIATEEPRQAEQAGMPTNRALPESVSDILNQRYQDARNAVQLEVLPGMSPQSQDVFAPAGKPSNELPAPVAQHPSTIVNPQVSPSPPNSALGPESPVNGSAGYGLLIPGAPQVPTHGALPKPRTPATGLDTAGPAARNSPPNPGPFWLESVEKSATHMDPRAKGSLYDSRAFLPSPVNPIPDDPFQQSAIYRGKYPVPTQRPLIELGRPLYTGGIYPPADDWLGFYNPVMPHFMVYGDFRTGAAANRNRAGEDNVLAVRLNLDMDLEITATERLHAFIGPVDRAGDFTRLDFSDGVDFVDRTDLRFDTLFFEGDAGAIWGGLTGQDAPFDFPFTFGFLPIFYQNGVWAADNVIGAAFALPWRNSPLLKWSNFDATFFWASDQINSDAFPGDNNAAEFLGTAWFIEAYDGYFEVDYAFVHDDVGEHRSYHNFSVAFSRRYLNRVSNSIRFITNFDQSLPRDQRTAEGHLLLIENSLLSSTPNTLVPYLNFFYGQGRTQSLARAGVAGGILFNTGINFQIDGLTGYPTLDSTGVNSTGAALGVNILGQNFSHQLILEAAAQAAHGSAQFRNAPGDQYAVGLRYQIPISNAWIFRTDQMVGFLRNAPDIRGSRIELRWKF